MFAGCSPQNRSRIGGLEKSNEFWDNSTAHRLEEVVAQRKGLTEVVVEQWASTREVLQGSGAIEPQRVASNRMADTKYLLGDVDFSFCFLDKCVKEKKNSISKDFTNLERFGTLYDSKIASLVRAAVQLIPGVGGALNELFSGLGRDYQIKRIDAFFEIVNERLRLLENEVKNIQIDPSEEFYDFSIQILGYVSRCRYDEKRRRFANIFVRQVATRRPWSEAERAAYLLNDLTDLHIGVLHVALAAESNDGVFEGLKIIKLTDKGGRGANQSIPIICEIFSDENLGVLRMVCSQLISLGLLVDEGMGFLDTRALELFTATDLADWLQAWISDPIN